MSPGAAAGHPARATTRSTPSCAASRMVWRRAWSWGPAIPGSGCSGFPQAFSAAIVKPAPSIPSSHPARAASSASSPLAVAVRMGGVAAAAELERGHLGRGVGQAVQHLGQGSIHERLGDDGEAAARLATGIRQAHPSVCCAVCILDPVRLERSRRSCSIASPRRRQARSAGRRRAVRALAPAATRAAGPRHRPAPRDAATVESLTQSCTGTRTWRGGMLGFSMRSSSRLTARSA